MKIRQTIAASVIALAAMGFGLASAPAYASSPINVDQWYSFHFDGLEDTPATYGAPLYGNGGAVGTNGPYSGGFENAIALPPDLTEWTINMPKAGYVIFTDIETSGDRFDITINGVDVGLTSNPNPNAEFGVIDIAYALGDPNYSSGKFYLPAGLDTISGKWVGVISQGDGDFYAGIGGVPEPAEWAMLLLGFGAMGLMMRGLRRNGSVATA